MEIHALTQGVWYTEPVTAGDRPALGLAVGRDGALLIDSGNSPAHVTGLLQFARSLEVPPLAVCLTHWHWDHVCGAVSTGLPVVACDKTARKLDWMRTLGWTDAALAQRVADGTEMEFCRENIRIEYPEDTRKLEIPAVDRVFSGEYTVALGGLTARILQVGSDHSPDCCVVHLVEAGVVFLGDCLYLNMDHEPWYRTGERTRRLLERLLALDARWYVPAHHGLYTAEAFREFAGQMTAASYAAAEAQDLDDAARRFEARTGRAADEGVREQLGEFLAARAYGLA